MNNINYEYRQNNNVDFKKYKGFFKLAAIIIAVIVIVTFLFNLMTFRVDERQQFVVSQFDRVVKVIVEEKNPELEAAINSHNQLKDVIIESGKGLYFKIPFIQTVVGYSSMLLTYDTEVREVTTKDKKKLELDNFAQWIIANPALFSISLKNERAANTRIDDIIYSLINEEIGKVDAITIISDKSYVIDMLQRVTGKTNDSLSDYGIKVVDIRIKRTDLPQENYNNIYNRMRTERERAAKTYRSEGREQAQIITSDADKEATIIEAQAYEKAQKLKGEGDAEALQIYAEAYNQDPEFYRFWRTLQAYKTTLNSNTTIVIDPQSEFAKYLFDMDAGLK